MHHCYKTHVSFISPIVKMDHKVIGIERDLIPPHISSIPWRWITRFRSPDQGPPLVIDLHHSIRELVQCPDIPNVVYTIIVGCNSRGQIYQMAQITGPYQYGV